MTENRFALPHARHSRWLRLARAGCRRRPRPWSSPPRRQRHCGSAHRWPSWTCRPPPRRSWPRRRAGSRRWCRTTPGCRPRRRPLRPARPARSRGPRGSRQRSARHRTLRAARPRPCRRRSPRPWRGFGPGRAQRSSTCSVQDLPTRVTIGVSASSSARRLASSSTLRPGSRVAPNAASIAFLKSTFLARSKNSASSVGAGPAALDHVDAEPIKRGRHVQLVGDRQVEPDLLRAVAQGGVVDLYLRCTHGHHVRRAELADRAGPSPTPLCSLARPRPALRSPPRRGRPRASSPRCESIKLADSTAPAD